MNIRQKKEEQANQTKITAISENDSRYQREECSKSKPSYEEKGVAKVTKMGIVKSKFSEKIQSKEKKNREHYFPGKTG